MGSFSHFFNKNVIIGVAITTSITVTFYSINMIVLLGEKIIGPGLIMPTLVGTLGGYLLGFFYNQRIKKQKALLAILEQQSILKEISLLSHHNYSLVEILDKSIHLILSASFAKLQSKGGIFLSTINNRLELKSSLNLSPQILNSCGKAGVEFGECLCGLAAKEKKTIFKHCVDHQHSISFAGMEDHGHYNVPILHENKALGVIVVYLNAGHKNNPIEIDFLEGVANVLSLVINSYNSSKIAKKNESALREIQELSGVGTWLKDTHSGNITASKQVFNILGYKLDEVQLSEEFLSKTVHPLDKTKFIAAIENAKSGISTELEFRHLRKDGAIANVINKWKPILNTDGSITEVSGTLIDVSTLRKNEAELIEKQHLVNGILSATPDPLYLLNLDTSEFVYCNAAMEYVLANNPTFYDEYKIKGVPFFREQVHPDDLIAYDNINKTLRKSKDLITLKFRTKIFGNEFRWIEQKVLVYSRKENGHVHQVLITSKDISEKIHAENRAKKLNIELSAQNKSIKKINRELDQFVYSVSHDLRAPLSSMLGLVNLSKLNATPKEILEYMSRIGQSVEKLDGFIKDILNYSRNARTSIEAKPLVLENIIMELIDTIRSINNPGIELDFEANESVTYIGDKRRIAIVLNNLISNAVKYADYSKPNRFLKVRITTSTKGCEIKIEDNGIGIKKEYVDKIFYMFYRATEKSEGSGLGLYIVKEIIKKLNGTISIESEESIGTKILLKIPHTKSTTKQKVKA